MPAARASLAVARLSADAATLELNAVRSDKKLLASRLLQLSATVDDMRHQHATTQSSISLTAFESLRGKRDLYLRLLCFEVGQFNRLEDDFTSLLDNARISRSALCRGVGPLLNKFRVFVHKNDIHEDVPVTLSGD